MITAVAIPSPFDLMSEHLGIKLEEVRALERAYKEKRLYNDPSLNEIRGKIITHYNSGNGEKLKARLQDFKTDLRSHLTKSEIERFCD